MEEIIVFDDHGDLGIAVSLKRVEKKKETILDKGERTNKLRSLILADPIYGEFQ